jgi:hypothetical protein
VSPDGKLVAVVEADRDAVAVLELGSGKVEIISPSHDGWKARLIPAWRTVRELTFGAPGKDKRRELYSWQPGGASKVLSQDWPAELTEGWVEGPK